MKKILVTLGILLGLMVVTSSASADLKDTAAQSNNPKDLVAYINSTKAGKKVPIKKVTNTDDNNYTVYVLKKKPKVASLKQRTDFAKNLQAIMDDTPANFQRNGIAFYQGSSDDGANFIIAFDKAKISGDYGHAVQFSKLGNLAAGTTACYFEPFFAKDDANGGAKSSPNTQGPKNSDGETLIEQIQDVTE